MTGNRFVDIAPWPRGEQEKPCLVFAHLGVHMILRFVIQGCPTLGMLQAIVLPRSMCISCGSKLVSFYTDMISNETI